MFVIERLDTGLFLKKIYWKSEKNAVPRMNRWDGYFTVSGLSEEQKVTQTFSTTLTHKLSAFCAHLVNLYTFLLLSLVWGLFTWTHTHLFTGTSYTRESVAPGPDHKQPSMWRQMHTRTYTLSLSLFEQTNGNEKKGLVC